VIRRDYILRTIAELVQVLARVVSLKSRQEYEQALREIDRALRDLRDASGPAPNEVSLEDWIALCRKHEQTASGLMMAVADLLREQGDLLARQNNIAAGRRSDTLALGLFLEAVLSGETFVSVELLDKVDRLFEIVRESLQETHVWRRLVKYFEARGRYAMAEDALFAWRETGDAAARPEGTAFYNRLLSLSDAELENGDLPRGEVNQGLHEFLGSFNTG
jgi:hypothetical protein